MSDFGWVRRCIHCGYFCYGHPTTEPCPKCGSNPFPATGNTWESLIAKIEKGKLIFREGESDD